MVIPLTTCRGACRPCAARLPNDRWLAVVCASTSPIGLSLASVPEFDRRKRPGRRRRYSAQNKGVVGGNWGIDYFSSGFSMPRNLTRAATENASMTSEGLFRAKRLHSRYDGCCPKRVSTLPASLESWSAIRHGSRCCCRWMVRRLASEHPRASLESIRRKPPARILRRGSKTGAWSRSNRGGWAPPLLSLGQRQSGGCAFENHRAQRRPTKRVRP